MLAEPVALQPLEVAQRRRPQRQGVRKHPAPEGALRRVGVTLGVTDGVGARKHPAPEGALRREDLVLLLVPLDAPERNLAPEGALRLK